MYSLQYDEGYTRQLLSEVLDMLMLSLSLIALLLGFVIVTEDGIVPRLVCGSSWVKYDPIIRLTVSAPKDNVVCLEQIPPLPSQSLEWSPISRGSVDRGDMGKPCMIAANSNSCVEQMKAWAKKRGATETFIELAEIYYRLGVKKGINPEGAYAQAAKETGFGRFDGVISEEFHNPCGLKITEGGSNIDPKAHQVFKSWQEGVDAHLDHLALYAGTPGYPKEKTYDPRHFSYLYGKAETFEDLGEQWAPSSDYGTSLIEDFLLDLLKTSY